MSEAINLQTLPLELQGVVGKLITSGLFDSPVERYSAYVSEHFELDCDSYEVLVDLKTRTISIIEVFDDDRYPRWTYFNGLSCNGLTSGTVIDVLEKVQDNLDEVKRFKDSGVLAASVFPEEEMTYGVFSSVVNSVLPFPGFSWTVVPEVFNRYAEQMERAICAAPRCVMEFDDLIKPIEVVTVLIKSDGRTIRFGLLSSTVEKKLPSVFVEESIHHAHVNHYKVLEKKGPRFTGKVSLRDTLKETAKRSLRPYLGYANSIDVEPIGFGCKPLLPSLAALYYVQVSPTTEIKVPDGLKLEWVSLADLHLSPYLQSHWTMVFIKHLEEIHESPFDDYPALVNLLRLNPGE